MPGPPLSAVVLTVPAMTVTLSCASRPRDDQTADAHHFEASGDTYADALAAAHASVPDGWLLLHVRSA